MKYKKLVRDLIPDIINANGEKPIVRKLGMHEFKEELKQKLREEASEVIRANSKKELIHELADVQEVLRSLYSAYNIKCGDVTSAAREKRKKRGAFKKRMYLEGVKK